MSTVEPETNPNTPTPGASQAMDPVTVRESGTPGGRRWTWEALTLGSLLLILLVGAYFRFTGLDWDADTHIHPDERFLTDTTSLLRVTLDPLLYLRTSESPLNPYNVGKPLYVYGNFPMTVVRLAAEWASEVCGTLPEGCVTSFTFYTGIHLVGRFFSALVDLVSILLVFFIGRRLYDWRVGLLAALLQALAVMPIQQSHFYTMDNWAAALTTVTLYMAVRASEAGAQKRWWALFGLGLGLTVASRVNMAPLAALAPLAAVLWLARRGSLADWRSPAGSADLQRAVLGVLLAAFVSLLTFRLAQPYAFADRAIVEQALFEQSGRPPGQFTVALRSLFAFNPQWLANMAEIQRLQSPDASFPPALQWTARTPILFPLVNMILYGMGITAGLLAWAGFGWALWRIARARPGWQAHLLPVAWVGLYFLFMGTRWVKSIRYFLPLYPFLFLLGAWALMTLWQRAGRRPLARLGVGLLALLVLAPSVLWAHSFSQIYRQPITRIAASRWMFEHVPSGATLLYELDGQSREQQLPLRQARLAVGDGPLRLDFSLPAGGLVTGLRLNYLQSPTRDARPERLVVRLSNGPELARGEAALELGQERQAMLVPLTPTSLTPNLRYLLTLELVDGGPVEAATSVISGEHWDDSMPVRVDGLDPFGQFYDGLREGQMPVTVPDSEQKRDDLARWLDEADYVVISSSKFVWSIPRLPLTYPLMIRYYEGLFNGDLGFDLVAQFHADLRVGPLAISDTSGQIGWRRQPEVGWPPPGALAAEEAFSVYDHPPVWIFAKSDRYSSAASRELLAAVDLSQQVTMTPGQATRARNGLMLSDAAQAVQRANGTFRDIFAVDGPLNRRPGLAAAVWWLAATLLGWLAFPLSFVVFRGLSSRGYILSRILAPLLIAYFGWLTASLNLLPNTRGTLLLGLGLVALLSLLALWRHGSDIASFVQRQLGLILAVEVAALAFYLLAILVRLGTPDVWDVIWGGEKPMDLAYFSAVLKSTTFPPYDPWFAGGYINYYYFGFVYVGVLTKLLGTVPALAYNLILPMLFSFTGMGAFSVAFDLVARTEPGEQEPPGQAISGGRFRLWSGLPRRALAAGISAAILAILLGNLTQAGVYVSEWRDISDSPIDTGLLPLDNAIRTIDGALDVIRGERGIRIHHLFWNASRALNHDPGEPAPITEFPFFTFLYGDLHAHMISMPLMMLALGWAVSLALWDGRPGGRPGGRDPGRAGGRWESALIWLVGGLAIGVLRPTNTWDWPTYLVIGSLAVFYAAYRQYGRLSLPMLGQAGLQIALLAGLSTVAFLPFSQHFGQAYNSVSLWPGSYSRLGPYLAVYGLFLFLIISYLAVEFRLWTASWSLAGLRQLEPLGALIVVAALSYGLAVLFLFWRGYLIAPVVLTLVMLAGGLALRPGLNPERRVALSLISAALFLTLAVEIVVLDGDIGRMNMVFKFYVQVWLILSVVGGAALVWVWPRLRPRPPRWRQGWQLVLGVLVTLAALYPVTATGAKWAVRMSPEAPLTLDGLAFMPVTQYSDRGQVIPLSYDYEAIQWMYRNIDGSPVIAEGHSDNPYRSIANRVANATGLPTIVGWDWHQRQQRAVLPDSGVRQRINDVNLLFGSPDVEQALSIIRKYDVRYIYVGQLEWVYYGPQGLGKFDQMVAQGDLTEVYRNAGVSIYQVLDQAVASR